MKSTVPVGQLENEKLIAAEEVFASFRLFDETLRL